MLEKLQLLSLATAFAAAKKKVLLIDMDPQNASTGFGIPHRQRQKTIYEVLINECSKIKQWCQLLFKLKIITSTVDLSACEVELVNFEGREFLLKHALKDNFRLWLYFYRLPPSLGLLTINSLTASNSILIPMQYEFSL